VLVTHDIDEALLLADRVAVMSSRPGRIVETVDMPFGADRTMETVVSDERYPELRTRLRALLRPAPA
jgi:NitT/TauT family transport system ATP-binding protein